MNEDKNFLSLSTILAFAVFLILSLAFFFFLNSKTGSGFGFSEILFSLAIAVMITSFLVWMKTIVKKNTYLGIAISFFVLIALDFSLLTQYRGPNTTLFLVIFSVSYLIYMAYVYFKFKNYDTKKFEYDETLN